MKARTYYLTRYNLCHKGRQFVQPGKWATDGIILAQNPKWVFDDEDPLYKACKDLGVLPDIDRALEKMQCPVVEIESKLLVESWKFCLSTMKNCMSWIQLLENECTFQVTESRERPIVSNTVRAIPLLSKWEGINVPMPFYSKYIKMILKDIPKKNHTLKIGLGVRLFNEHYLYIQSGDIKWYLMGLRIL